MGTFVPLLIYSHSVIKNLFFDEFKSLKNISGILKKYCFSCNVKVDPDMNFSCSFFDKIGIRAPLNSLIIVSTNRKNR